jgi:hypothetical protein
MLTDQIVRANRAADSLFGGPSVREFAACEFPREDLAWVAAQTRRSRTHRVPGRSGWGRFWRVFGTPEEPELETEAIADSAPA